jgi:hypothetical protein
MTASDRLTLIHTKIERANLHLRELVVLRDRFMQSRPYAILSKPDAQPGFQSYYVTDLCRPPEEIALIAGDVIHNLRTALDHLAYQLVIANGGVPTTATCFPIHDDAKSYNDRHERQVRGMAQDAIDAIGEIKPYKGGNDALWILHKLDIEDKHHALFVAIISLTQMVLTIPQAHWGPGQFPGFALPKHMQPLTDGDIFLICEPKVFKDIELTFDVGINQPAILETKPVVDLLTRLISVIDNIVIGFEPLLA